ncbi:hypothetical protein AAMO2058_000038200 [Amorphochlora amoebiformis]
MATQRARSTAGTVRRPITSEEKLRKKVPANRKYNKVKPVVKTGVHVGNIKKPLCTKGEIFHRVNRGQLSQLMLTSEYSEEQIQDLPGSARRTVEVNEQDEASKCSQDFLLLDFRDIKDYKKCHIKGATQYSPLRIRRDQFTAELYAYRNKSDKIVIVYEEKECKAGIDAATLLVQKGYSNIYLLTGGLKRFAKKFPELVFGENKYEGKADSRLPTRMGTAKTHSSDPRTKSSKGFQVLHIRP